MPIELVNTDPKMRPDGSQRLLSEDRTDHLRLFIQLTLETIRLELMHYEQTTHSSLFCADGCSVGSVMDQLAMVYSSPGAYSISELAQRLDSFLKKEHERARR